MSQNISNLPIGALVKEANTKATYDGTNYVPVVWRIIDKNVDAANSVTLESLYVTKTTQYSEQFDAKRIIMTYSIVMGTIPKNSTTATYSVDSLTGKEKSMGYREMTGSMYHSKSDGNRYSYYVTNTGSANRIKKSINAQSGSAVEYTFRSFSRKYRSEIGGMTLYTYSYPYVNTSGSTQESPYQEAQDSNFGEVKVICVSNDVKVSNTASGGIYNVVWNSSPVITTPSTNLGDKTRAFTTTFKVTDEDADTVSATVKLDGTTIQSISSVTLNTNYTISIDATTFIALALGSHTILITATDGTETVTKSISFQKVSGMGISGSDGDLGNKWIQPTITYQVYDDNDLQVDITEKVDGEIVKELEDAPLNTDITFDMSAFDGLTPEEQHTLKIEAVNADESTATRTWTFTKLYQYLEFYTDTVETDISAERIYVVLDYDKTNNPEIQVLVCNNAGGTEWHYEDATEDVLNGQPHTFHYTPAEGTEGVSVMVRLIKNENTERVYFNNIGFTFS